jgi:cyclopropane fatty-acyl-phospholipid synthase-like methyltransferase
MNIIGGQKTLSGKTLIEVGCGRGGCLRYIIDQFQPEKAFGVDISEENIKFNNFEKAKKLSNRKPQEL